MPNSFEQKLKILYLLKILQENTDEKHHISMNEIIDKLSAYGIQAERKSIYSHIEALRQFGVDIICQKTDTFGYYIGNRDFELAELKLLVDSVQASRFITKKKSNELIKKIESLTNKHNAKELQRQVYTSDRVKSINEKIYYNVDTLHSSITDNKKVAFKYYEYGIDKKIKLRNNAEDYIISPYSLIFSDENYYVIAHYPKYEKLTHFRVDKMSEIRIIEEKSEDIKRIMGDKFNLGEYSKKIFNMFSGETQSVEIECDNKLINVVIDKFGIEASIRKSTEDTFIVNTNVNISPTFFAWVFTFGGMMKIISPKKVMDEFVGATKKVINRY